ncbi:MAG: hypothetical protein HYV07_08280 [Deltaproteobacteria bacterium]|nr:hypothetical protein [Deltaproteobacteria bacterium]
MALARLVLTALACPWREVSARLPFLGRVVALRGKVGLVAFRLARRVAGTAHRAAGGGPCALG